MRWTLRYFENFLNFVSAGRSCFELYAFSSLVCFIVGSASSTVRVKFVQKHKVVGIKNNKSVVKKKKKKHDSFISKN